MTKNPPDVEMATKLEAHKEKLKELMGQDERPAQLPNPLHGDLIRACNELQTNSFFSNFFMDDGTTVYISELQTLVAAHNPDWEHQYDLLHFIEYDLHGDFTFSKWTSATDYKSGPQICTYNLHNGLFTVPHYINADRNKYDLFTEYHSVSKIEVESSSKNTPIQIRIFGALSKVPIATVTEYQLTKKIKIIREGDQKYIYKWARK